MQVYGKLHASVDSYNRDTETVAIPGSTGVEITSNSSRLGFKDEKELVSGVNGLLKFESEIDVSGETGTLSARNRYVGLGGAWGSVVLGIHDTPLKEMLGYAMFGDTVATPAAFSGRYRATTTSSISAPRTWPCTRSRSPVSAANSCTRQTSRT